MYVLRFVNRAMKHILVTLNHAAAVIQNGIFKRMLYLY